MRGTGSEGSGEDQAPRAAEAVIVPRLAAARSSSLHPRPVGLFSRWRILRSGRRRSGSCPSSIATGSSGSRPTGWPGASGCRPTRHGLTSKRSTPPTSCAAQRALGSPGIARRFRRAPLGSPQPVREIPFAIVDLALRVPPAAVRFWSTAARRTRVRAGRRASPGSDRSPAPRPSTSDRSRKRTPLPPTTGRRTWISTVGRSRRGTPRSTATTPGTRAAGRRLHVGRHDLRHRRDVRPGYRRHRRPRGAGLRLIPRWVGRIRPRADPARALHAERSEEEREAFTREYLALNELPGIVGLSCGQGPARGGSALPRERGRIFQGPT